MKTVYFVRHGESDGNAGLVFQGLETPLTERGRQQAVQIAERCAKLEIQTIISSPMKRASMTADAISARIGIPVEISEHFSERRRPTSILEVSTSDPEAARINTEWMASLFVEGKRVLDGEDFASVRLRADKALTQLVEHSSDNILVATHGFFLCFLLARIVMGEDLTPSQLKRVFDSFHVSNTGLSILRCDPVRNAWWVATWNDHAHLG